MRKVPLSPTTNPSITSTLPAGALFCETSVSPARLWIFNRRSSCGPATALTVITSPACTFTCHSCASSSPTRSSASARSGKSDNCINGNSRTLPLLTTFGCGPVPVAVGDGVAVAMAVAVTGACVVVIVAVAVRAPGAGPAVAVVVISGVFVAFATGDEVGEAAPTESSDVAVGVSVGVPSGLKPSGVGDGGGGGVGDGTGVVVSCSPSSCAGVTPGVAGSRASGIGETISSVSRYQISCLGAPFPQPTGPSQRNQRPTTVISEPSGSRRRSRLPYPVAPIWAPPSRMRHVTGDACVFPPHTSTGRCS